MNFLAHAYLSFDYEPYIIGNMISDFVKGRKKLSYSNETQKGIELHRNIDTYTDTHPQIIEAKKIFVPKVGLYAGAFVDVAFDFFLANDKNIKTPEQWEKFTAKIYHVLSNHTDILPEKFLNILPYMTQEDWLYNYRFTWGIKNSFLNLQRRAKFLNTDLDVFSLFENNIDVLQKRYDAFFPFLYDFAKDNVRNMIKDIY